MTIHERKILRKIAYQYRTHRQKSIGLLTGSTLKETLAANFSPEKEDYIFLHWANSKNFGDWVSFELTRILSQRKPLSTRSYYAFRNQTAYSCVGSTLQWSERIPYEVWGSGFISASSDLPTKPKKIHAVRGPLTRKKLFALGVSCGNIFGDPAALYFNKFCKPLRSTNYKIGLIPHYADSKNAIIKKLSKNPQVILIDVFSDVDDIAAKCNECDVIASSSLHGLIMADTLMIPNVWLSLSETVTKGGFKFIDYFLSVNRSEETPLAGDNISFFEIVKKAHLRRRMFSFEELLDACPFRTPEGQTEVGKWIKN